MTKKDIIKKMVNSFDLNENELKKLKIDQLNELNDKLSNPESNDSLDDEELTNGNIDDEDEIIIDIKNLSKNEYRFFLQTGQLPKRFIK